MSSNSLFFPLSATSSPSLSSSSVLTSMSNSSLSPELPVPSSPTPSSSSSTASSSNSFIVTELNATVSTPSSPSRAMPHKQNFIPMLYREDVRLETFSTWWSSSKTTTPSKYHSKQKCRQSRRLTKCSHIERNRRRRRFVNKELAALVGLYYTGYDELLCCYFCHCIVDNADTTYDYPQENDIVDVFEKHLLQSPECPLMRLCSNQTTRNVEICRGRLNKLLYQMENIDNVVDHDDNYRALGCESDLPHQHRHYTDSPPDPSSSSSLSLSLPPVKPVTPVLYDRDLLADELISDKTPYQNICLSCRQYVRKSLLKPCRHKPTCYFCSQFFNTCMICTGKITKLSIVKK